MVILYGKLLNSQSLPTSTSDLGDDRPLAEARYDFPGGNNQSEGRRWNQQMCQMWLLTSQWVHLRFGWSTPSMDPVIAWCLVDPTTRQNAVRVFARRRELHAWPLENGSLSELWALRGFGTMQHTHTCVYIYTNMYICICIFIYICMYSIHTHIYIYICICIYIYIHAHVCIFENIGSSYGSICNIYIWCMCVCVSMCCINVSIQFLPPSLCLSLFLSLSLCGHVLYVCMYMCT